jgi:hypothetical protein
VNSSKEKGSKMNRIESYLKEAGASSPTEERSKWQAFVLVPVVSGDGTWLMNFYQSASEQASAALASQPQTVPAFSLN